VNKRLLDRVPSPCSLLVGDTVVSDLPNTVENLVLQVACSRLGVSIATMKSANEALVLKGFAALADAGQAPKGAVVLEMVTKSSNQNR